MSLGRQTSLVRRGRGLWSKGATDPRAPFASRLYSFINLFTKKALLLIEISHKAPFPRLIFFNAS